MATHSRTAGPSKSTGPTGTALTLKLIRSSRPSLPLALAALSKARRRSTLRILSIGGLAQANLNGEANAERGEDGDGGRDFHNVVLKLFCMTNVDTRIDAMDVK